MRWTCRVGHHPGKHYYLIQIVLVCFLQAMHTAILHLKFSWWISHQPVAAKKEEKKRTVLKLRRLMHWKESRLLNIVLSRHWVWRLVHFVYLCIQQKKCTVLILLITYRKLCIWKNLKTFKMTKIKIKGELFYAWLQDMKMIKRLSIHGVV